MYSGYSLDWFDTKWENEKSSLLLIRLQSLKIVTQLAMWKISLAKLSSEMEWLSNDFIVITHTHTTEKKNESLIITSGAMWHFTIELKLIHIFTTEAIRFRLCYNNMPFYTVCNISTMKRKHHQSLFESINRQNCN